jgi:2-(1,2-epoxy-1,2-dihydrophenyl)acetyl-CoA isomerase
MTTAVRTTREGKVALIELNRPDAKNAIDAAMRRGLLAAVDDVGRDPGVLAVVLTGAGSGFCAGADLKALSDNPDTSLRRVARSITHEFQPAIEGIARMDKPVIAAINGNAVGIGIALALSCDLIVMAEDAQLMPVFTGIGIVPDGGASWFLTRRLGYSLAFEILAEAQRMPAARCRELGIANRVVPAAELRQTAMDWAGRLAERAPLAVALTKRVARLAVTAGLSETIGVEADLQAFLTRTDDVREAIAAFNEKRKPNFSGD